MKKWILIFISLFCFGMQVPGDLIIKYGRGTKILKIGDTNLETAVRALGKDFITGPSRVVSRNNPTDGNQYEFQFVYRNQGISLFFYSYSDTIYNISVLERVVFFAPTRAKTMDNIILGFSTDKDIVHVLGEPDNRQQKISYVHRNNSQDTVLTTALHYHKIGTSFIFRRKITVKESPLSEIEIYKPSRESKEETRDIWDVGPLNVENESHRRNSDQD
jgi:hypothetical protein